MFKRFVSSIVFFRKFLIKSLIIFIFSEAANSQPVYYTLNYPGSVCYISYLCFAPDNNYSSTKRPYIFILGQENQTAQQIFDNDTLKNSSKYYNALLYYVPSKGASAKDKLYCINALVSVTTNSFKYGHVNLFLQVNDKGINQSDIILYGLKMFLVQ